MHSTFLTAPDYRVHQCSAVWHQQHWSTTPDQQLGHKRLFLVSRIEELTDPLLCASFEAPVVRINFTVSRNWNPRVARLEIPCLLWYHLLPFPFCSKLCIWHLYLTASVRGGTNLNRSDAQIQNLHTRCCANTIQRLLRCTFSFQGLFKCPKQDEGYKNTYSRI